MGEVRLSESDIERFWQYVDFQGDDDCWNWTGWQRGNPNFNNNMYGSFGVMHGETGKRRQSFFRSNRVAYYIEHGYWPKHHVLHGCDNPLCVNPAHLRDGTPKENTDDMTKKKRHGGRFENGHTGYKARAKITQEIADQIRAEHVPAKPGGQKASETSIKGLARKYGLSKKAVQFIVRGEHWISPVT